MTMINPAMATPGLARGAPDRAEELRQAANAFEAIFLRQMLSAMQQAGLDDELLSSSTTRQFQSMHFDAIADQMAKDHAFGIAEMLQRQFADGAKSR